MGSRLTGRAGADYGEAVGDGNVPQAWFPGEPIGGSREIHLQPKRYRFILRMRLNSCSLFHALNLFHRKKGHKFGREKEAWWRVYPSSANLSAWETKALQSVCRNSRFIPQGLYHCISTRFCSRDSARLFRTTRDRVQVQALGLHGGSLQWPCSHWRQNWTLWNGHFHGKNIHTVMINRI